MYAIQRIEKIQFDWIKIFIVNGFMCD